MAQYIDKSALVAEMERLTAVKPIDEFWPQVQNKIDWLSGKLFAINSLRVFLNTLEVKEVQEEPVSNDLKDAAIEYCGGHKGSDARVRAAFVVGANWKKQQMMKDTIDGYVTGNDGRDIDVWIESRWIENKNVTELNIGDKVKLVIIKEE